MYSWPLNNMGLNCAGQRTCRIFFFYSIWKWSESYFLIHVQLFGIPWTVACPAPLSIGFSRQEYWSGLPFPSPADLSYPGTNPGLLHCRQILYQLNHWGSPSYTTYTTAKHLSQPPRDWLFSLSRNSDSEASMPLFTFCSSNEYEWMI